MPKLIELPSHGDKRGILTVIEKQIEFGIKRVYYMYNLSDLERGGHRHNKTIQALICVHGSCVIENNNGIKKQSFLLDKPNKCLVIYPEDWHIMKEFKNDAILLVLASEYFDANDYIDEKYT